MVNGMPSSMDGIQALYDILLLSVNQLHFEAV
jgi:hypothetical protein